MPRRTLCCRPCATALVLSIACSTFAPAAAQQLYPSSGAAAKRYLQVLEHLAAGSFREAFEARIAAPADPELGLGCLREVRLTTLDRLAEHQAESLLPIVD